VTVEFLAGLPTDAVMKRVRALGDSDIVYTPGYFQDGTGRIFLPFETVRARLCEGAAAGTAIRR
jgi:hypothetical protein